MMVFSLHPQGGSEVKTSGTSPQKILEQGTPAAGQKYSKPSAWMAPYKTTQVLIVNTVVYTV